MADLFLPETQAIAEMRQSDRGADPWRSWLSLSWLQFFRGLIRLFSRIFETGVQNGVVVTDDTGNAIAIEFRTANVPFVAGDFTADSGAWTLTAPDVVSFSQLALGHIRWVNFNFELTTVTATPLILSVLIPGGAVSAHDMQAVCEIDDNGTLTSGLAYVTALGTTINFVRQDRGTFATAANTTGVRGQLYLEIE